MSFIKNIDYLKKLPKETKRLLSLGLIIAFLLALPLFVYTIIFGGSLDLRNRAAYEHYPNPNACGGTCGSNYNCQANLYCYNGFCRDPLCRNIADCDCSKVTPVPTPTPIKTLKPTIVPSPSTTPTPTKESTSSGEIILSPELLITPTPEASPSPTVTPKTSLLSEINPLLLVAIGGIILSIILIIISLGKKKTPTSLPPQPDNPLAPPTPYQPQ